MFILKDFGLYLVYLLMFIISYFTFEKIISSKYIIRISRPKLFDEIIGGLYIGAFTLMSFFIIKRLDPSFSVPLFVSSTLLILILKNYMRSIFSIVVPGLFYIMTQDDPSVIYMTFGTLFGVIVSIVSIKQFSKKDWAEFMYVITFVLAYNVTFSFGTFYVIIYDYVEVLKTISIIYIYLVFGYVITNIWIRFTLNSRILYEQSRLAFLNYLRPSIFVKTINQAIYGNNIRYGALILFRLNIDKNDSYREAIESNVDVEQIAYELISKNAGDKAILFNIMENQNGIFLPLESVDAHASWRMKIQDINFIKYIIHSASKQYVWDEEKEPISININAGVSIYGLDNLSINELLDYSSFALDEQEGPGNIQVFESKKYLLSMRNSEKFKNMDKTLHLDSYANNHTTLINVDKKKIWGNFYFVENVSEFQFFESIDETIFIQNWYNMFNRFYAAEAVKNDRSNTNIIFDYSPTILENKNFDKESFVQFFHRNGVDCRKVILYFKEISMNKIRNYEKVKKEIEDLRKEGVRVAVQGTNNKLSKKIGITPEFIILNNKDKFNNFEPNPETQLINPYINTEQEFIQPYKNDTLIFGGPLFDNEINVKKIDKKSKIYIEVLKKRSLKDES